MCRLGVIGINGITKWSYCSSETSERRATSSRAYRDGRDVNWNRDNDARWRQNGRSTR